MSANLLSNLPISFSTPSIDQPFGVKLWPIFDSVYTSIMGYSADDFRFVINETPMSTLKATTIALISYYVIIFGGRELMRSRPAMKLNGLFMVHNFILTVVSFLLLVLYIEQLLPTLVRKGTFHAICHYEGGWTKPLVLLYYLTYLTKYLELLDTVFLVLKKKPLTFLHTYHHGATALLCYTQLIGSTAVSWVPITLNLVVHVVMYWYYFQSARGIRIWWKEWITRLQIAQFVIDLGFVYFASYTYFTSTYWPWLPNAGKCAGEEFAAFAGLIILSSYLLLFISFYLATYKKGAKSGRPRRNTGSQAALAMKNMEVPHVGSHSAPVASNGSTNGSASNGNASNGNATTTARANGPVTRSRKA
ncbi:Elongation of fatty acids protein [Trichophyton interdigitale]|uniref:Elongation of fatty acids protein n=1 Tax=Trichophyton interdigitale TaxID=101480 RepID=A0A9P5CXI2_9EURO|nr:Elongation of fatty acids protein [Trichophyton interdigitale]KAF3895404.1 Elongation of fatty acids protein [Trichophyton interdigitale]KAG8212451.1 Elongation of fatty acids protein [Trichophyton interdigitale]